MALVTIRRSSSVQTPKKADETDKSREITEDGVCNRISKSLNECYFANKGSALVLGGSEQPECELQRSPVRAHPQTDIHHHLQAMFYLLRPEETLKMAVKLESAHSGRTRYLVVVCRSEEAALLGIDCNEYTTIGLVLRVLADTSIKLDGDGGFSVNVCSQQHIFKPVSVQAMWSALQTLHRASARARELNHFAGGASHSWCTYYEAHVDSDRSCLNEWHAMDSIESRRPPSPDSLRLKPRERDETERVIRCTLKEILMSVDLDEVTSKAIRGRLEDDLDMDLGEYKSFIDQEMLTILGQMDAPTEIFDHVYLGSEWNASNLEELRRNGVRHILNVTREIDNFFPGVFDYLNVRVYDDDKTDLLKHWDNTFKYINKARNEGSKVLVHCKMGISRSASVVIAYAMKAYNWRFDKALKHVKAKRSCIKPNNNFLNQLETYQGILDAMKNKEKLQRSKSETNLKPPKTVSKAESKSMEPTPLVLALTGSYCGRPRSWAPDSQLAGELLPPTSVSLENLVAETRHMLMPCAGGSYSVSPNQIIRLKEEGALSVKHIVSEIESAVGSDHRPPDLTRKSQRLNFDCHNESSGNRSSDASSGSASHVEVISSPAQISPMRNSSHKPVGLTNFEAYNIHTWDPGEVQWPKAEENFKVSAIDYIVKSDSGIIDLKTVKTSDAFRDSMERNLDLEGDAPPPCRQSSWISFDSAVVRHLSRHSSWGSYDTYAACPQPCVDNKSYASPTCGVGRCPAADPGIVSQHAEPPARCVTIADNERKFNETCAILQELASTTVRMKHARSRGASTWSGRLSASAPAATWLRTGPRRHRLAAASHGDLPRAQACPTFVTSAVGVVSNLKKEFEARSESDVPRPARMGSRAVVAGDAASPPTGEDLSVRVLVDRYDQPGRARGEAGCEGRVRAPLDSLCKKSRLVGEGEGWRSPRSLRNSFCGEVWGERSERPPLVPTVPTAPLVPSAPSSCLPPVDYPSIVVSTVISKAQNKKQLQHGKTHPLTRLSMNRSNNIYLNSLYNTM